jgi:hypothetical protein
LKGAGWNLGFVEIWDLYPGSFSLICGKAPKNKIQEPNKIQIIN